MARDHPLTQSTRCIPDIVATKRCGACHGEGINRGSYNDCDECDGTGRVPYDPYELNPCPHGLHPFGCQCSTS